jgi:hypothetical protein
MGGALMLVDFYLEAIFLLASWVGLWLTFLPFLVGRLFIYFFLLLQHLYLAELNIVRVL